MNELDALQSVFLGYDGPLVKFLVAMSLFRLIFKPITHHLAEFIASTPSHFDDEIYAKVTGSSVYRTLSFCLDLLASIKLPRFRHRQKAEQTHRSKQRERRNF